MNKGVKAGLGGGVIVLSTIILYPLIIFLVLMISVGQYWAAVLVIITPVAIFEGVHRIRMRRRSKNKRNEFNVSTNNRTISTVKEIEKKYKYTENSINSVIEYCEKSLAQNSSRKKIILNLTKAGWDKDMVVGILDKQKGKYQSIG
jgi:uncharacterized membrane protein YhiD involved in acid resistance